MPRVQLFQSLASDMRIDGRRRDIGVPEQQLHDAKIRVKVGAPCFVDPEGERLRG